MPLHSTTFGYLSPTENQKAEMEIVRSAAQGYARVLEQMLPEGPDKTFVLRSLRTVAMWANVAITRGADGAPLEDAPTLDYPADHPAPGDLGSVPL